VLLTAGREDTRLMSLVGGELAAVQGRGGDGVGDEDEIVATV